MNELQKDNNPKTPPAASPEKPATPAAAPAQPVAPAASAATPAAKPATTAAAPAATTSAKPATTPPSSTTPSPQNNPANKNTIQFHSAMTTKASQPKDFFAEQNKKREESKKKRKKQIKLGLIIGIPLGILAIGAVVMLIIWNMNKPVVTPSDVNQQTATDVYDKAMEQFNKRRPTSAGADSGSGSGSDADSDSDSEAGGVVSNEEAIAEANKIFNDAIAEANENRNTGEADAIRVAQLLFYYNASTDYSQMIEIGEQVQNPSALELQQQLQYYNILANAYSSEGNAAKAKEFYIKASETAIALSGGQEEGGVGEGGAL